MAKEDDNILKELVNNHVPLIKKKTITLRPTLPQFNGELSILKSKKRKLEQLYIKNPTN